MPRWINHRADKKDKEQRRAERKREKLARRAERHLGHTSDIDPTAGSDGAAADLIAYGDVP